MAALVEGCELLISNDSGLMHIATAVRTPVIALFGPTNRSRTGPVWKDCRIMTGRACSARECFPYPFESTWSGITCEARRCWEALNPRRVLGVAEQMLTEPFERDVPGPLTLT
jgi:ADP-heptose:LPS heptosyltransferase